MNEILAAIMAAPFAHLTAKDAAEMCASLRSTWSHSATWVGEGIDSDASTHEACGNAAKAEAIRELANRGRDYRSPHDATPRTQ